jgi:hypothetical protein
MDSRICEASSHESGEMMNQLADPDVGIVVGITPSFFNFNP